jgi:hypothetical protein
VEGSSSCVVNYGKNVGGIDEERWMNDRTGQAMYVYSNTVARWGNHCCSGPAINITYSECVLVTLGIQHSVRMRQIVIHCLPRSTMYFHIFS